MRIVSIAEYKKQVRTGPARITFHSAKYAKRDGQDATINISVEVANGDVLGVLEEVRKNGGIWVHDEKGQFFYLPWPCAAVEVENL